MHRRQMCREKNKYKPDLNAELTLGEELTLSFTELAGVAVCGFEMLIEAVLPSTQEVPTMASSTSSSSPLCLRGSSELCNCDSGTKFPLEVFTETVSIVAVTLLNFCAVRM